MDLYNLKNKKLTQVESKPFNLEKDIQTIIEENTQELFNLQFVTTELSVGDFRIDSLCFDEENKSFVIIEYKKHKSYSVIDQGYSYLSLMLNNKSDFILEYNENNKNSLKRSDVDWSQSRIIFISPSFNTYQKNSVNFKDVPFELWEIKRFSNNVISLNQHLPSSKESIQKIEGNKNSVIKNVGKEVKVYDESDLLKKSDEKTLILWEELQNRFNQLEDTTYVTRKHYIGIRKNNTTVTYVHFYKTKLLLHIVRGNFYDGKKSKGFFSFDDPKKISKSGDHNFKSGVVRKYYELVIEKQDDIDYVMVLLKQKYNSI
jgi:hypothetical protein